VSTTRYSPGVNKLTFPDGFLWGTATAAHQVEGNNSNSDWWDWETKPGTPCVEPSGAAIAHYRHFTRDIAVLAGLGFNTYRFSVEWARVEPKENFFDESEIAHYRKMVSVCHKAKIKPMVTLNHFTLPQWVADRGGWLSERTAVHFERYVRKVVTAFGDSVEWYCTINEPGVVAYGGYLGALGFPPGTKGLDNWNWATGQLIDAHRRALKVIKEVNPRAQVGMTHAMQEWVSNDGGRPAMEYARRKGEDVFLEACGNDDFIGVQTYTRQRIDMPLAVGFAARAALAIRPIERILVSQMMKGVPSQVATSNDGKSTQVASPEPASRTTTRAATVPAWSDQTDPEQAAPEQAAPDALPAAPPVRTTQMGYEFRPQAIAATVRRVAELLPGKPIIVTEHGVATDNDEERIEFITEGLKSLHALALQGIPIKGYIHWSAFDNFEWDRGYGMHFGLIAVDRTTQEREPKPSAHFLGDVARKNRMKLPDE